MGVFITTAIFSIFAYVWMFIVLKLWSPDEVEIAEAILTLVFFILLVVLAFSADKYNEHKKKKLEKDGTKEIQKEGVTREEFYRIVGVREGESKSVKTKKKKPSLKEIKKEGRNIEHSQITASKKDVEGEELNLEDIQEGLSKKQKSYRDTVLDGETRKVSKEAS